MSEIHVSPQGSDDAEGSSRRPFRTINRAAWTAMPGDVVLVHEGEYREWVRPRRGGLSDGRRITYQAVSGEHVVVKGSERATGWEPLEAGVWEFRVPNSLFGGFNPYAEEVAGDWIIYPAGAPRKHLGEVYLNGISLYEVASRADLTDPALRTSVRDEWTGTTVPITHPERTRLVWTADVGEAETTIWANFQGADPNAELVEINVRRSVFYPESHHLDYITVRGFELAHAASPWAPPTADQPGLIGPNWAKGWVIEDNHIHDAKCAAISIGKEASTGHNYFTERGDKPGYQYQLESVFSARQIGWDREHIGSHVIRRNTVHDCGQAGIVGHLGCVFSTIEDNHIYNVGVKREFYGYEIGGIKLHAPIDVSITHNRIHDCSLGIWLDWQAQGTRVSRNIFYRNSRDLFIEVSHGPYLVDNNILGSDASLELLSQGGAFVNNLVCGTVRFAAEPDRATPYHRPHSTQVAGFAVINAGDDRYIGNVFLGDATVNAWGPDADGDGSPGYGTAAYDPHPSSFDEYLHRVDQQPPGTHRRFMAVLQPVYIRGNVYGGDAVPFSRETDVVCLGDSAQARLEEDGEAVVLDLLLPVEFDRARPGVVDSSQLARVRFADAEFEDPDGTPALIAMDLLGRSRDIESAAGPIGTLRSGRSRLRIW